MVEMVTIDGLFDALSDEQKEDVELGLRLLIEMRFSHACTARLERQCQEKVERFDRSFEQAVETYRAIVGKDVAVVE